jgi:ADP-ribose pyrophosphatase YjhB (NUDIX family)
MNIRATVYRALYPIAKIYWYFARPKTVGAGCIIEFQGDILLVRNTYGNRAWGFPGGGVKANETPKEGVMREVREEVGVILQDPVEIGSFVYEHNHCYDTIHVFRASVERSDFRIDPGEILEAHWMPFEEISRQGLSSVGREMFRLYCEHRKGKI